MTRVSATTRISLGLTFLTIGLLFVAQICGLVPDHLQPAIKGRAALCEVIGLQLAGASQHKKMSAMRATVKAIVDRNPDLLSLAVRGTDGEIFIQTDRHQELWGNTPTNQSTTTHVQVPIRKDGKPWATLELRFNALTHDNPFGVLLSPGFRLVAFVALAGFFAYVLYLRRVLRHLDPSAVVPERVRAALDTLAEGVLILDENERIVLANDAFCLAISESYNKLLGRKVSKLPWVQPGCGRAPTDYPWTQASRAGAPHKSCPLKLAGATGVRMFMVNSAPILGGEGRQRGTMVTFNDVTGIEEKNVQLQEMLKQLEESQKEVRRQNVKLKLQASRDPLTNCLNRRAFFEEFETEWSGSKRYGHSLGCILLDIDHFKAVNDTHGHKSGDVVLQKVAETLKAATRDTDAVCRYGGEEFCISLPHADIVQSKQAAEKIRKTIEATPACGIAVTVSLGVSAIELGAENPPGLIEQADQALYAAKNCGRNQSVRWDQMPEIIESEEKTSGHIESPEDLKEAHVPFHAVRALVSALDHRDPDTASHCRRVADLCVLLGQDLMSANDCFVLEVAGLLHDIGKIGVPDTILLKPGPLTGEEWKVMEAHERMGIEIINAAFNCVELTNIIRTHHAFFGGTSRRDPGLPTGLRIPLRARILSIADAFDAMTCDRPHQKKRSIEEACAELRRCAGTQFDPILVGRFIKAYLMSDEKQEANVFAASTETALRIGLEIERLAAALDTRDFAMLTAITDHLTAVATKLDLPQIAKLATEVNNAADVDHDLELLLVATEELLELCSSTQSQLLECPARS